MVCPRIHKDPCIFPVYALDRSTCTMVMIAATIGGPINIAKTIPLIMSLKNNHIVCCKEKE